jgi:hypothetical protein
MLLWSWSDLQSFRIDPEVSVINPANKVYKSKNIGVMIKKNDWQF